MAARRSAVSTSTGGGFGNWPEDFDHQRRTAEILGQLTLDTQGSNAGVSLDLLTTPAVALLPTADWVSVRGGGEPQGDVVTPPSAGSGFMSGVAAPVPLEAPAATRTWMTASRTPTNTADQMSPDRDTSFPPQQDDHTQSTYGDPRPAGVARHPPAGARGGTIGER